MFQVNPMLGMKNQALFSSRDKSKKLKCRLLQFLFVALRVNGVWQNTIHTEWVSKARFHVTVITHINKSMVYFIVRLSVNFGCSEC